MIRELTAAEFLSGKVVLRSVIGEGMNAFNQVEKGIHILSEDVVIEFSSGQLRKFYQTDKLSIDFIYEEIRSEVDFLNTGTKLRPIFSPPSGHLNLEKKTTPSTIFIYDLHSLVSRKAKLPFYLYVNDSGTRKGHVTILARNVQVKIAENKYINFEKDKCTVEEVLFVCDQNSKKKIDVEDNRRFSVAKGFKHRKANGSLDYELLDILLGDAVLPVGVYASYERITEDVNIIIGDKRFSHKKGDLTKNVETWKSELSLKSTIPYGYMVDVALKGTPKTFRIEDLMSDKASLPVVSGYLLGEDIIITFLDGSEKLYKKNFLFSEIWNDIYTLYIMSKVADFGYPNPVGKRIFERLMLEKKLPVVSEEESSTFNESLLISYKDHVRSVIVLKDLTEESDIAERFNKIVDESALLTQKVFFARRI